MRNVTYISAGAGSGKTYCLTDKLASILADGKIRGENIMMTTFTDLAAGELKRKAKAKSTNTAPKKVENMPIDVGF